MVHNVGVVLGLQDPEVPVHIGHDAWAADTCINHLQDDRDPMRVEGQSLNRLTLLTLHESSVLQSAKAAPERIRCHRGHKVLLIT